MNKSPYVSFSHYETPTNDFERARQQISTPFDFYDVDLSIARENVILQIAGDFLYIDMASTGYATIELNNQHDAQKAPFLMRKGFALGATFKQLKITNNAQADAFLRIMFSTGEKVIPALGDVNISGSVNTIEDGLVYGSSFKSTANIAANGNEVVFTAAANVNGAVVHMASYLSYSANFIALVSKSGAPASIFDGDVLLNPGAYGPNSVGSANMMRPVSIPAGRGLYFTSQVAETGLRSVLYTLK